MQNVSRETITGRTNKQTNKQAFEVARKRVIFLECLFCQEKKAHTNKGFYASCYTDNINKV